MSAFENLTSIGKEVPGVSLAITHEEYRTIQLFHRGMEDGKYYSLELPKTVLRIDPQSAPGFALAPELDISGATKFSSSIYYNATLGNGESVDEVGDITAKLLNPDPEKYSGDQQEKIRAQYRLCKAILLLDSETHGPTRSNIHFAFDQQEVSSSNLRNPFWHIHAKHEGETLKMPETVKKVSGARIYAIRSSAPDMDPVVTEFIMDNPRRLSKSALKLIEEIGEKQNEAARKHKRTGIYEALGRETYADWQKHLKCMDLFFHPKPYEVVLFTHRTATRSQEPERPTPSCYIQISIVPTH